MAGRVGQQPEHRQHRQRRRAARRQQRQLNAGHRQQADHVSDVDQRLCGDQHGDRRRHQPQERIGRPVGDAQTDEGEDHEQRHHQQAPDQPEFLTDDREDEVVVRVGQIVPFGTTLPEPHPEHTAVGQGVGRLTCLVSGALRIVDTAEEAHHALRAIALDQSQHDRDARTRQRERGEHLDRQTREPQQGADDDRDGDRGRQVRLEDDQQTDQQTDRQQRDQQFLQWCVVPTPRRQQMRTPHTERDLHQLRRLHRQPRDDEPASGTLAECAHPGDQHQRQQHRRDHHQGRGHPAQQPHRQSQRQVEDHHAQQREHDLRREQTVGRSILGIALHRRRREHHHQPERRQQERQRQDQVIRRERAAEQAARTLRDRRQRRTDHLDRTGLRSRVGRSRIRSGPGASCRGLGLPRLGGVVLGTVGRGPVVRSTVGVGVRVHIRVVGGCVDIVGRPVRRRGAHRRCACASTAPPSPASDRAASAKASPRRP